MSGIDTIVQIRRALIIMRICNQSNTTTREIADELGISIQIASNKLNRMVKKGMVRKGRSSKYQGVTFWRTVVDEELHIKHFKNERYI